MIWFLVIVPVLAAIASWLFFDKKMLWWDPGVSIIATIIVVFVCVRVSEISQTADTEWLGFYVAEARYYEPWDEKVTYTEEVNDGDTRDSRGRVQHNSHTEVRTRIDEHAPEWTFILNSGEEVWVDQEDYEKWKTVWKKTELVDMHRDYHSKDGDMYRVPFDNVTDHLAPYVIEEIYENRVKASGSVFKHKKIDDPKSLGLYDYPSIVEHDLQAVMGNCSRSSDADTILRRANAMLGMHKQVRMFILLYRDAPQQTAVDQESYWQGGNKNEFILCVGLDKQDSVQWAKAFSWTEREDLKVRVAQHAMNQKKFDVVETANFMTKEVSLCFERKHFRDFSYLSVEMGVAALITTIVLVLLFNIGYVVYIAVRDNFKFRRLDLRSNFTKFQFFKRSR